MMTLIGLSLVIYLCLSLLLRRVKVDLLLPSSVLVGLFLCLVGPNGLGKMMGDTIPFYQNLMGEFDVFSKLPGELINFVFAGIFLGQTLPSIGLALKTSRSHLLGGYWLGLGQHFIGVLVGGLVLSLFFNGHRSDGLGEFCQCAGTSAIGLRYVKHVSAKAERGFNYKQILYEPFLGGGLFTALAIPLVNALGWAIYCLVMAGLLLSIGAAHCFLSKK